MLSTSGYTCPSESVISTVDSTHKPQFIQSSEGPESFGGWADPLTCAIPVTSWSHPTRSLVYCSTLGFSFVSCRVKSSTVPVRRITCPGNLSLMRYMSEPQVEQKQFVIVFPEAMVFDWLNVVRFSWPRMCLTNVSATMKLVANIDAVIFRQSVQWQMNVLIKPGPCTGWGLFIYEQDMAGCLDVWEHSQKLAVLRRSSKWQLPGLL